MGCVCIIPARGGSRRLPRKNIRPFHGKPIIAYSIATARESGLFNRVVVSTEDGEIAQVARAYGADVQWRDEDSSRDEVGTQEVAARALERLGVEEGNACVIYPCAPLLTADDLKNGATALDGDTLFAFSVGTEPLSDAGAFYVGKVWAFRARVPLIGPMTAMVPLPANRVCDVNTLEDFRRAEELYMAMRSGK